MNFDRVLLATTSFHGHNGVAEVSRQAARVFPGCEVWELGDGGAVSRKLKFGARAVLAAARDWRNSLVLSMHVNLIPALAPLRARGSRMAVFLHGIEAWEPLSAARRSALARASLLVSNSRYTLERFHAVNPGFEQIPSRVAWLGAHDAPPAPATARGGFALITGRMFSNERYKGHDLLIDLWPALRREVPDARLVVCGGGDDLGRLRARATDGVEFTGPVPDERLRQLYQECAFLVMPSTREGFGLVFLEAMRAGKACIAGPGAPEEVVAHEVTGLIAHPERPGEVLDALTRLFRGPEARAAMGRAGRARYEAHFTEDHFRQRLAAAVREIE